MGLHYVLLQLFLCRALEPAVALHRDCPLETSLVSDKNLPRGRSSGWRRQPVIGHDQVELLLSRSEVRTDRSELPPEGHGMAEFAEVRQLMQDHVLPQSFW